MIISEKPTYHSNNYYTYFELFWANERSEILIFKVSAFVNVISEYNKLSQHTQIKYLDQKEFENVTINQFNTYRLGYNPVGPQRTSSPTFTRLRNSHNKKGHTDAITHFKKTIKRDKS